ncbi:hypothetical protein KSP40_PGU000130 [Platanthera guangdongensis]|uniref:Uncharacterized protein n=1 Tax=Platanthera guangdongensis TaxID=2320717 RepID=A0ABR2MGZ5_9ASPA
MTTFMVAIKGDKLQAALQGRQAFPSNRRWTLAMAVTCIFSPQAMFSNVQVLSLMCAMFNNVLILEREYYYSYQHAEWMNQLLCSGENYLAELEELQLSFFAFQAFSAGLELSNLIEKKMFSRL